MSEIDGANGGRLTPFQPGQSGNPGGKTSEQKRLEMENAAKATRIRAALLDALVAKLEAGEAIDHDANTLKLVKDSEDRGLGAPQVQMEVTDKRVAEKPPSADEWAAKHDAD